MKFSIRQFHKMPFPIYYGIIVVSKAECLTIIWYYCGIINLMAIIHRTTRLQKSRFLRLVLGCNIEGNPLFPYGFHNENINRC